MTLFQADLNWTIMIFQTVSCTLAPTKLRKQYIKLHFSSSFLHILQFKAWRINSFKELSGSFFHCLKFILTVRVMLYKSFYWPLILIRIYKTKCKTCWEPLEDSWTYWQLCLRGTVPLMTTPKDSISHSMTTVNVLKMRKIEIR